MIAVNGRRATKFVPTNRLAQRLRVQYTVLDNTLMR